MAQPAAQTSAADSLATVRVQVREGDRPAAGAIVRALATGGATSGVTSGVADPRAGLAATQADAAGVAVLRLSAGPQRLVTTRAGLRPDTLALVLRAGQDTSVTVRLASVAASAEADDDDGEALEAVVVSATRGERRVDDSPLRVEVVDGEEVAEKLAMRPASIQMLLAETGGLRVQPTSPSLGAANVRVQGLRGRYTLLLTDGLPLAGEAGGFSLLQTPLDLARVEVLKGATGLYSGGVGGVINLVSRRPTQTPEHTALVNQTSRGGSDALAFLTGPLAPRWGYTLLAGAHRQRRGDADADGWTDLPGYDRVAVRPRLYHDDGRGRTAFLTAGLTAESRAGGTLRAGALPGLGPDATFAEGLGTRRLDVGGLARWVVPDDATNEATGEATRDESSDALGSTSRTASRTASRSASALASAFGGLLRGSILAVRGSAVEQRHAHRFGPVREDDRHRTWFGEATVAVPRPLGARSATWVAGVALQQDSYRNRSVAGWDYTFTTPAAFVQAEVDAAAWLALSSSVRADAHSAYGTFVHPRLSVLVRRPGAGPLAGWTTRLSGGTGMNAPTPLVEEVEAVGLSPVVPVGRVARAFVAERARGASLDVGGPLVTPLGRLEVNATLFGSRIAHPLEVRDAPAGTASGATRLVLVNAPAPTRTAGAELLARLVRPLGRADDDAADADRTPGHEAAGHDSPHHGAGDGAPTLRVTASYTHLRATECDPDRASFASGAGGACARRLVPLTPRHAAALVASVEQEGRSRVGLELYYTGRQALEDDPYRATSRPYVLVGLLAERAFPTRALGVPGVARAFVNLENLTNVRQTAFDPLVRPTRGPGGRWTTAAWTELVGFTANAGVRLGW